MKIHCFILEKLGKCITFFRALLVCSLSHIIFIHIREDYWDFFGIKYIRRAFVVRVVLSDILFIIRVNRNNPEETLLSNVSIYFNP